MAPTRAANSASLFLAALLLACSQQPAAATGALQERRSSLRPRADLAALRGNLTNAVSEALGCGGHVGAEQLDGIEAALAPTWRTLAKNAQGNVDRRSLRFLVHRYFSGRSALHLKGFEPARPMGGASGWGGADILSQIVPAYVESVLESRQRLDRGFGLRDAATMVATLEQLLFDSEAQLLEQIYAARGTPLSGSLDQPGLSQVLETYLVHWLMGEDTEGLAVLLGNRSLLETAFPHWGQLVGFANGQVEALEHARRHSPRAAMADGSAREGHNALSARYSVDDAHRVVGKITGSFASFWESECSSMKGLLVAMDTHHTGRVPLAKFYASALETDWRFGESEAYLRELGALDETSWRGKQVIIPNYIQAASNCIVTTKYYSVCCMNECEGILADVEQAIGAPAAEPEQLLAVVANISSHRDFEDDAPPELTGTLSAQLQEIAAAHGGQVPLHGRLFAQWLHYAFPRDCPFPHKAGTASAVSPSQFGDGYVATADEMKAHAAAANSSDLPAAVAREDLQWMSQWSPEEELIAEHAAAGLHAPWKTSSLAAWAAAALLLATGGTFGAAGLGRKAAAPGAMLLPMHSKQHAV